MVEQRLATKTNDAFTLDADGVRLLKLHWEETSARVRIQIQHIEAEMETLNKVPPTEPGRYLEIINGLSESISDLSDEYGFLVDRNWMARSRQGLRDLREEFYRRRLNAPRGRY